MFEWRRRTQDLDVRTEGFELLLTKFFKSMSRHEDSSCCDMTVVVVHKKA